MFEGRHAADGERVQFGASGGAVVHHAIIVLVRNGGGEIWWRVVSTPLQAPDRLIGDPLGTELFGEFGFAQRGCDGDAEVFGTSGRLKRLVMLFAGQIV